MKTSYRPISIRRTGKQLVGMVILSVLVSLKASCQDRTGAATRGEALTFEAQVKPWYKYRKDGQAGREVMLRFAGGPMQCPATITIACNGKKETNTMQSPTPVDSVTVLLPAGVGLTATTVNITVQYEQQKYIKTVAVPGLKQWTVFIYPHSHLDIGYTALPADVQKLQTRNIDVGIDIARKTQNYPEGARFIWNTEATWIVVSYLKTATKQQKQQFIEAVKKGWIQIDGGHSNINTTACSDEELLRFFSNVTGIERLTGKPITTMVQMDVPGAAWGLVSAAAQYGVKGMISFPNNYDVRKQYENKPFYWLGPDGKTKLFFLQGFPYGLGYTLKGHHYGLRKLQTFSPDYDRVGTDNPSANFLDPFIFEELERQERSGAPYDLFAITWSMADNCVIDADLPDAVKAWNETYAYPKLMISGAKEILDAYEKKYSAIIPQYMGDITEWWTNGLGSDAASVGKGRAAQENLVQAETLWSLLQPKQSRTEAFRQAWENLLLSVEHTWGAQHSTSLLAQQIEKIKAGYFANAEEQSNTLIREATAPYTDATAKSFSVINTLSWERDAMVTLTPEQSKAGDRVLDDHRKIVPSQRLSTGELIFLAQQVPGLGSRLYTIVSGKAKAGSSLVEGANTLRNDRLTVQIDPATGNISHVKEIASGYEYADSTPGLDVYQYVKGVYNGKDRPGAPTTTRNVTISIKEKGPLMASLLVKAGADGVKQLTREVRLYNHRAEVEVLNTLDKLSTTTKEGIHIGFGFHVPDATGRVEMPWSVVRPNTDQLTGANKNWLTFQHWVDISNAAHGITWTALQSPLIEWGSLSGNVLDGARQPWFWQREIAPSATIYSWPVNNHWDTNFPLEQGGMITQNYTFTVHDRYDVVAATRFGLEAHRPLIVVQTRKNVIAQPLFTISNPRVVISTLKKTADNKALLLRVKSVSDQPEQFRLNWPGVHPVEMVECTADETPIQQAQTIMEIEPYGMTSVRLVF